MTRPAPSFTQAMQALLALALHPRHAPDLEEAAEEYFGASRTPESCWSESDTRSFIEWAVFDRKRTDGSSLVDVLPLLPLPSRLRRRMEAWPRCRSRFYRVLETTGGTCVLVDLLPSGPRRPTLVPVVCETTLLEAGDLLLGRVLPWEDGNHLAGTVHVFPPSSGARLPAFFHDLTRTLGRADRDDFLRELLPLMRRSEEAAQRGRGTAAGVTWPGAIPPVILEAVLQQGLVCLARGRWAEAITSFEHVLGEDPLHVEARNGVGLAWLGRGHLERARRAFDSILSTHPGNATALLNLGNLELCCGRVRRARELLEMAREQAVDDTTRRQATANLCVAATEQPQGVPVPCT